MATCINPFLARAHFGYLRRPTCAANMLYKLFRFYLDFHWFYIVFDRCCICVIDLSYTDLQKQHKTIDYSIRKPYTNSRPGWPVRARVLIKIPHAPDLRRLIF